MTSTLGTKKSNMKKQSTNMKTLFYFRRANKCRIGYSTNALCATLQPIFPSFYKTNTRQTENISTKFCILQINQGKNHYFKASKIIIFTTYSLTKLDQNTC